MLFQPKQILDGKIIALYTRIVRTGNVIFVAIVINNQTLQQKQSSTTDFFIGNHDDGFLPTCFVAISLQLAIKYQHLHLLSVKANSL